MHSHRYIVFATYDGLKGGIVDREHSDVTAEEVDEILALDAAFWGTDDFQVAVRQSEYWMEHTPSKADATIACWLCDGLGGVALHEKWSAERGKPLWTAHEHPSADAHLTKPCPACSPQASSRSE